jgi:hypothetical protein
VKIFYSTPLFSGLQVSRGDPLCLEMICFDRATITISLQSGGSVVASPKLEGSLVNFRIARYTGRDGDRFSYADFSLPMCTRMA